MKKIRFVILAFLLASAFAGGPLMANVPSSASAQQEIPPACVETCRQLLVDCIAQGKGNRCVAVYRSCIARCK